MQFRIARHSNKMLFWHAITTHAIFSLMTGLILYGFSLEGKGKVIFKMAASDFKNDICSCLETHSTKWSIEENIYQWPRDRYSIICLCIVFFYSQLSRSTLRLNFFRVTFLSFIQLKNIDIYLWISKRFTQNSLKMFSLRVLFW